MKKLNWEDDGYYATETRDLGNIRWVLIVTMLLNFVATGVKLAAGIATGALSILADSLDSLFDGLSNVVGLAGLYAAAKPPDAEHPYGHRKFETIAALSIAFLLFLSCYQLLVSAWERLGSPFKPDVNVWTAGAMLLSMVVQAATSWYELRAGRRLKSEILVADALHTRASILVSGSVLVGLVLVRLGFPQADPILAAFVAVVIAKIGIDILRETLPVLVDRAALDPNDIAKVVSSVKGVESFHRVRSRGAEGSAAVDLHLRVSPHKTIREADAIANEVRRRLLDLDSINDVTIHLEVQRSPQEGEIDLFAGLKQLADEMGLTIHESWAHRLNGALIVEAHVGVDPSLTLGQAHSLMDRFERELRHRMPQIDAVHTHIEMATTQVSEGARVSEAIESRVQTEVEQLVAGLQGVENPHNLIVRHNQGVSGQYHVSLECDVSADTPISEAHYLSSMIEHELSRRLPEVVDVFVHLEPRQAEADPAK